jgi:DNA-binding NarL/FixJ family response regulator
MNVPSDPIRILTVDDHPLVRDGIVALVANCSDLAVVAEASSGVQAIEQFRKHRPDVTLMDVRMKGMGGIEAIEAIRAEAPRARIVVLTTYHGDVLVQRALKAGAQAYLLKSEVRTELIEVIRAVHAGQKRIQAEVAIELAEHSAEESLSDREVSVLRLIAAGNSNKHIARHLDLAEGTVKTHVKNILSKMRANDRTHAATLGIERGIIGF